MLTGYIYPLDGQCITYTYEMALNVISLRGKHYKVYFNNYGLIRIFEFCFIFTNTFFCHMWHSIANSKSNTFARKKQIM